MLLILKFDRGVFFVSQNISGIKQNYFSKPVFLYLIKEITTDTIVIISHAIPPTEKHTKVLLISHIGET